MVEKNLFDKEKICRQLRNVVFEDFGIAAHRHLISFEEHDRLFSMINSFDIESIQLAHEIIISRLK